MNERILNKARTTKSITEKDLTMNKTFQKVAEATAKISGNTPSKRIEYLNEISMSKAAREAAVKAKEAAETGPEFDKACEAERRAIDREAFFTQKLEGLKFTPHMEEAEYYDLVHSVESEMKKAAEQYASVTKKAMMEIVAAKKAYVQTAEDADAVLDDLDAAANLLQSKYRYAERYYAGGTSCKTEDAGEWRKHMVRFSKSHYSSRVPMLDLALKETDDEGRLVYNMMLLAAWHAAEQAQRPADPYII